MLAMLSLAVLPPLLLTLVWVLVICLIAGVAYYLIDQAPVIAEPFKSIAKWAVLVVGVVFVVYLLLGLLPLPRG